MAIGTTTWPRRSRALAMISQLSVLGCQVVLAGIIRFTVGRTDPFVRAWAAEALNLQLVWIVPWLGLAVVADAQGGEALFWAVVAYNSIVGVYAVVVGVMGAVKAWHG